MTGTSTGRSRPKALAAFKEAPPQGPGTQVFVGPFPSVFPVLWFIQTLQTLHVWYYVLHVWYIYIYMPTWPLKPHQYSMYLNMPVPDRSCLGKNHPFFKWCNGAILPQLPGPSNSSNVVSQSGIHEHRTRPSTTPKQTQVQSQKS